MNWILDYSFTGCRLVDMDSDNHPINLPGDALAIGQTVKAIVGDDVVTVDLTGIGYGMSEYLRMVGVRVRGVS